MAAIAIAAEQDRVASATSEGNRANLACVPAECDATAGIAERVANRYAPGCLAPFCALR
jgi:hypothetical protein